MNAYTDKNSAYFAHARREIAPLLAAHCGRVLELGCGAGATLAWLREQGITHTTVGLEISAQAAQQARGQVDCVHTLDLERDPWPDLGGAFDTILCLDVLEHLVDPWRMVDRLVTAHLAPAGRLVVSLPNVRHRSVLWPLLVHGRWTYAPAGILDQTHLRFFTRSGALELLDHAQLDAPCHRAVGFEPGSLKALLRSLTFGLGADFFTYQHLVMACKRQP